MSVKPESAMPQIAAGDGARKRRRIGLLLTRTDVEIDSDLLKGVVAAASENDLDVVCFAGGHLIEGTPSLAVFDLALEVDLDGVIIGTALAHLVSEDALHAFCARYSHVPLVTGELGLAEFPSLAADSFTGLYNVITHLIEVHGCRRIAFIQGPAGQPETVERLEAYRVALADHSIAYDTELVVAGNYILESGVAAMETLLERFWSEGSGVALDAVVAANDAMAVGAHHALVARGVRVPEDVALAGFDDAEAGRQLMPPLTTVRQSFTAIGRAAVELLVRLMDGETITGRTTVPAEAVIRRSCGCAPEAMVRAASAMAARADGDELRAEWEAPQAQQLWHALWADISHQDRGRVRASDFLVAVETQLHEVYDARGDPATFHNRLSGVRQRFLSSLRLSSSAGAQDSRGKGFVVDLQTSGVSFEQVAKAEDLLHQARVLTSNIEQQITVARAATDENWSTLLRNFDTAISSIIDLESLSAPITTFMPQWHINELYMVRHESVGAEIDRGINARFSSRRRLILAYHEGKVQLSGDVFAAPSLLPDRFESQISPPFIILPLLYRERLFGYMLLTYVSIGTSAFLGLSQVARDYFYRRIAESLGSVLYRAQLLSEAEEQRRYAEASLQEIIQTRTISDRLQRAPDAEAILRIALEELTQLLGAPRAVVRLGTADILLGPEGNAATGLVAQAGLMDDGNGASDGGASDGGASDGGASDGGGAVDGKRRRREDMV